MKLWTFHNPEFSLLDGVVDWARSGFYQDYVDVREAYHHLLAALIETQVLENENERWVWCCPNRDDWPRKNGYCEWEMDVPETGFLAIVDTGIWIHRWCNQPGIGARLRSQFMSECMDAEDHYACLERKMQEYGDRDSPLLLFSVHDAPMVDVLLRHPVNPQWVIRTVQHA